MAKAIKPEGLADAIREQLTTYHEGVITRINNAGAAAINSLVKRTKATAPERSGNYKKNISSKQIEEAFGFSKFLWYVKAPFYRLTHLLVNGHATANGGRTEADPFLEKALKPVLEEYERSVEEALIDDQ